jgi:serine/threonine protein kinase
VLSQQIGAPEFRCHAPLCSYLLQEIKRPFASKADRSEMLKEYTAVHSLPEHPNVVNYFLFWQESRKLHIQMELCEGGSLDSLLKRNELSGDDDLQISEAMVWVLMRCAPFAG